jgi:hypothetical protein
VLPRVVEDELLTDKNKFPENIRNRPILNPGQQDHGATWLATNLGEGNGLNLNTDPDLASNNNRL